MLSRPNVYETPVDVWVRGTGLTRSGLAKDINVSSSTLLKARAQESRRGRIHWTSVAMIACRMGLIQYGERITEDDPRIMALMLSPSLIGVKGSRAHNWWG